MPNFAKSIRLNTKKENPGHEIILLDLYLGEKNSTFTKKCTRILI